MYRHCLCLFQQSALRSMGMLAAPCCWHQRKVGGLLTDLLLLRARTRPVRMNCFHIRRARSMSVSVGKSLALPALPCKGVGPQDRSLPHTAEAWHRKHLQSAVPIVLAL